MTALGRGFLVQEKIAKVRIFQPPSQSDFGNGSGSDIGSVFHNSMKGLAIGRPEGFRRK